jgi:hypothetical protein
MFFNNPKIHFLVLGIFATLSLAFSTSAHARCKAECSKSFDRCIERGLERRLCLFFQFECEERCIPACRQQCNLEFQRCLQDKNRSDAECRVIGTLCYRGCDN